MSDQILTEILEQLKRLIEGQARTEERLASIEEGQIRTEERLVSFEKGQHELKQDVAYLTAKVEGELTNKVGALFDAREVNLDSDKRLEQKMDILASTVDNLRIEMLKGFEDIRNDQRAVNEVLGEHSVEIKVLARKVPQ